MLLYNLILLTFDIAKLWNMIYEYKKSIGQ